MVIYRLYDGHRDVDMQECRNWQTSKTKDLVINAIVWVQVPSPACQAFTGSCKCLFIISREEVAFGVFLADMPNTPCLSQGSLDLQLVFVRVEKAPGTGKAGEW